MDDLITFVRARLDEDEAQADEVHLQGCGHSRVEFCDDDWCDCGKPARVRADVEAKRRIVELHESEHECSTYDDNGERDPCTYVLHPRECSTLRLLATAYADHPDFRDEWRP